MARGASAKKKIGKKKVHNGVVGHYARLRLDGLPSIRALMCKASTGVATSLLHPFRV